MMRCWILFLLISALGSAAQADRFQIRGTVVHGQTGAPMPRVKVFLSLSEEPNPLQTVTTDEQGHFAFPNLPPGKYGLSAVKYGFPQQGYEQHGFFWTGV